MFTTDDNENHSNYEKDVEEVKNTGDATTIDDDGECENCEATPIIFCDEFLVKIQQPEKTCFFPLKN